MSKFLNLKKGLAIGATLALAVTGISAIPANANVGTVDPTRVSLAPTTGLEYNVTTGSTFNLSSNLNTGKLPQVGSLKFLIESSSTADRDALTTRTRNEVPFSASSVRIESTGATSATYTMSIADGYKFESGDFLRLTQGVPGKTITIDLPDNTLLTCTEEGSGSTDDVWRADGNIVGDGTTTFTYPALAANTGVTLTGATATTVSFSVTGTPTLTPNAGLLATACGGGNVGTTIISGNIAPGLPTDIIVTANLTGVQTTASNGTTVLVADEIASPTVTNGVVVDSKVNGAAAVTASLSLAGPTGTTTRAYVITAWADADGDNEIDAGEFTSTRQTVTFVNPASVVLAANGFEFTNPTAASTTLTAKITTVPVLNQLQSLHVPRAFFTKQVASANVLQPVVNHWGSSARATAAPAAGFEAVTSTTLDVLANSAGFYSARPYLADRGSANGTVAGVAVSASSPVAGTFNSQPTFVLGASVAATVAADRIAGLYASTAGTNNVSPDTSTSRTDAIASSVRLGTAAADVSVLAVSETVLDTPIGAGKTVIASISDSTNFKINAGNGPVSLTTNAAGTVSVSVSKVAPAVAGSVTVTFTATNVDGNIETQTAVLEWVAASYTLFNLNDTKATDIEDNFSIKANESISFAIALHDQWKVPAPTATYRVTAAVTGTGVNVTTTGALAWSGNTANLTIANNGTTGQTGVMGVSFDFQVATAGVWGPNSGSPQAVNIAVVPAALTYAAEVTSSVTHVDDIQDIHAVRSLDSRSSQLARSAYAGADVVVVGVVVRDAVTGLPRPFAKVNISGPADFMFFSSGTVDRLGSLSAISNASGVVSFSVMSNRSVVDAVITVTADGGTGTTAKVTFDLPPIDNASKADWSNLPKSVKAGRTLLATVSITDKWGNAVEEDSNMGDQSVQVTTNRGFVNVSRPVNNAPSTFQVQVLLQPLDRGPVVLNFTYEEGSISPTFGPANRIIGSTVAVWSGPAVNATAGAKKGRVVVEAYRAVGKTVDVFVGSTKVATFTPDVANDRFVVRGVKSGTRNVSVRIVGPGYDFPRTAITVK